MGCSPHVRIEAIGISGAAKRVSDYGKAALPRRPKLRRNSSFALPGYEKCGLNHEFPGRQWIGREHPFGNRTMQAQ
jgi:hypothetical protein